MTDAAGRALSLNEVEHLGLKAARGAGCAWGVAEDVGRAARWLAARDLGWAPSLVDLLGTDPPAGSFVEALAVADGLARGQAGDSWTLKECPPGWLLAAMAAAQPALPLTLSWQLGRAVLHPDGTTDLDPPTDLLGLWRPAAIRVVAGGEVPAPRHGLNAATRRASPPPATLAALEALALRTAVPASASSRAAGAGGGRVDDE